MTELLSHLRHKEKKKRHELHYSPPSVTLGSGEMTGGKIKWSKLFLSLSVLYTDAKPSNKISDILFFFKHKYINKQATKQKLLPAGCGQEQCSR